MPASRVILAYSHQPGQLPPALHATLRERLPYARRLRLAGSLEAQALTLAGIELARALLGRAGGRAVPAAALRFPHRGKPRAPGLADFSISHAGEWVGCALALSGRVGFDLDRDAAAARAPLGDWTAREAVLKAAGGSLGDAPRIALEGEGACYAGRRWLLRAVPAPLGYVAHIALEEPAELELVWAPPITENCALDERIPAGRHDPEVHLPP